FLRQQSAPLCRITDLEPSLNRLGSSGPCEERPKPLLLSWPPPGDPASMSHLPADARPESGPISLKLENQQNHVKVQAANRRLTPCGFGRLVFTLALLI